MLFGTLMLIPADAKRQGHRARSAAYVRLSPSDVREASVGVLIFEVTEVRLIAWQPLRGVVGALARGPDA